MLIYRRALLKSTTLDTDPLENLLSLIKRIKYIRDTESFKKTVQRLSWLSSSSKTQYSTDFIAQLTSVYANRLSRDDDLAGTVDVRGREAETGGSAARDVDVRG